MGIVYFGSLSEDPACPGGEAVEAGSCGGWSHRIHSQEAESGKHCGSACLPICIQSGLLIHGMMGLEASRWLFLPQQSLSGKAVRFSEDGD